VDGPEPGGSIGDYLVSARSFAEYRAMFALTDADLGGRVLDCPGGGSSFTATARARGVDARAVDPVYALPADRLAARMAGELARGARWTEEHRDRYVWDHHGSPADHARLRAASAELFVRDLRDAPERYVPGALPHLPFRDGAVDLVLSSHLLFTYADRLDVDFHRAALLEMVRVGRGQVRVYPLVDQAGAALPGLLDALLADLAAAGVPASVRPVPYEFQRGATDMLELDAR
jgi:hypothetical protein